MDAGIYVLLVVWSLGLMYFIHWKIKMAYYEEQMVAILQDMAREELKNTVKPYVSRCFQKQVETYLLESKIVDRSVHFRWIKGDLDIVPSEAANE